MNARNRFIVIGVVALLFISTFTWGAGFKIPEQGTKAMGMGLAWTAQASDPSAIYFNPAGVARLKGQQLLLGGTSILADGSEFAGTVKGVGPTDESGRDQFFVTPLFYYTYQANDRVVVGVGVNSPVGLSRTYDVNKLVRFSLQHVKLQTIIITPTIGIKLNDTIAIGFGAAFMHGFAELDQQVSSIADFHLDGEGNTYGWNAGILITPGDIVRFGVSFRSGYNLDIRGDGVLSTPFGKSKAQGFTMIKMGDIINAGLALHLAPVTVEFDYDYTNWSVFRNLDIILSNDVGIGTTIIPKPKNWNNAAAYRLGARYDFSPKCYGSAGIFYDETPVPAATLGAELPDADRVGYTLGGGCNWGKISLDVAYLFMNYNDRSIDNASFNGTWKNEAHLFGVNLVYKF